MIVPMAKVSVVGPRSALATVLERVQQLGVLDLRAEPVGLDALSATVRPHTHDELAREQRLSEIARAVRSTLALLPDPREGRRGDEQRPPDCDSRDLSPWLEDVHARAEAAASRRASLDDERDGVERFGRLLEALAPLVQADALREMKRVETVGLLVRRDAELEKLLETDLPRLTGGAHTVLSREHDGDVALLIAVPREQAAGLDRLLATRGVAEMRTPGATREGTFAESLSSLLRRRRELPDDISRSEAERAALERQLRAPLTHVLRDAEDRLVQLRSSGQCAETERLFLLSGFLPRKRVPALAETLASATDGAASLIEDPLREEDHDEVPVLLDNPRLLRPFELVLGLLPPPRYGTVDPTPLLAAFFPVFYGLMLGDVGYGALVLLLALIARRRRLGGEAGQKAAFIGICCAASSIVFGFLFGEFFGDLGAAVGMRPILVSRADPRTLLGLVLSVGAVHVALGVGVRLWMSVRRRSGRRIVANTTQLAVLAAAALVALERFGHVGRSVGAPALVALGPLSLVMLITQGLLSPIDIVKMLGSVLSYARLMAIGMASVMLADVANRMTTLLAPLPLGIFAALLLHVVNLVLGIVGPAIQATRLHLVEFFDTFYEPGGRAYAPLSASHRKGDPWTEH